MKSYLILLLFLFSGFSCYKKPSFESKFFQFNEIGYVRGVEHGDFNGDGEMDFLFSVPSSGTLYLALGTHEGEAYLSKVDDQIKVEDILTIDLDNDKDLDFVANIEMGTSDQTAAWLNNGEGAFERIRIDTSFTSIAKGDIDGDGKVELVMGRSNKISIYQFVDGQLKLKKNIFHGGQALDVLDFENDGDLDVVATEIGGGIHLHKQVSHLEFEITTLVDAETTFNDSKIKTCNINGDNIPDLFVYSWLGRAKLFESNPKGGYEKMAFQNDLFSDIFGSKYLKFAKWGDFNGDGKDQLLCIGDDKRLKMHAYLATESQLDIFPLLFNRIQDIGILDYENDGDLDYYVYTSDSRNQGKLVIHLNQNIASELTNVGMDTAAIVFHNSFYQSILHRENARYDTTVHKFGETSFYSIRKDGKEYRSYSETIIEPKTPDEIRRKDSLFREEIKRIRE